MIISLRLCAHERRFAISIIVIVHEFPFNACQSVNIKGRYKKKFWKGTEIER